MSKALNNQPEFFRHMQEGMQQYFNRYDRQWGGIMYFTVGVREGKVGGIIKSEDIFTIAPMKKAKKKLKLKTKNSKTQNYEQED